MLPSARIFNCRPPPDSRSPVKIKKYSAACPAGMFEHEMPIEQNGLDFCQKRIVSVDVRPASLHHGHFGVSEMINGPPQEILWRSEISVENSHEFALRRLESFRQSSRFKPFAITPVMVGDWVSQSCIMLNQIGCYRRSFIRGVIQHLDFELVFGVIQVTYCFDQPTHHVLLVENRQLNGYPRWLFESSRRRACAPVFVLVIQIHEDVAMHSVRGQ